MKTLIEALLELDPDNPNHWTSDGLPKVDALRFATANPSLTRDDITTAAPLFTRDNRVLEEPESVEPVKSADPVLHEAVKQEKAHEEQKKVAVATMQIEVKISEALRALLEPEKIGDTSSLSDEELKAKREKLSNVVKEIAHTKHALELAIADVQADLDKIIIEQESRRPKSGLTATQMYLEAQKKRKPEDMLSDHLFQNPIDDPVARMVARNMMRRG
ncbi:hypothetical protein SA80RD_07 [Escherichia phage vB_EcoS_SA80RD]|nr:hypothetical protein SA80RD_07 [Escherichia phage vB_EcoS_SA80RD]